MHHKRAYCTIGHIKFHTLMPKAPCLFPKIISVPGNSHDILTSVRTNFLAMTVLRAKDYMISRVLIHHATIQCILIFPEPLLKVRLLLAVHINLPHLVRQGSYGSAVDCGMAVLGTVCIISSCRTPKAGSTSVLVIRGPDTESSGVTAEEVVQLNLLGYSVVGQCKLSLIHKFTC